MPNSEQRYNPLDSPPTEAGHDTPPALEEHQPTLSDNLPYVIVVNTGGSSTHPDARSGQPSGRSLPQRPVYRLNGDAPEGFGETPDPAMPTDELKARLDRLKKKYEEANNAARGADNLGTQERADASILAAAHRIAIESLEELLRARRANHPPTETNGRALGSAAISDNGNRR